MAAIISSVLPDRAPTHDVGRAHRRHKRTPETEEEAGLSSVTHSSSSTVNGGT